MLKEENLKKIIKILKTFPKKWDGKKVILEMRDNGGKHWRQTEWPGWYFEFLCEKYLKEVMEFNKIKYGKVFFDGFLEVPFDFKAHTINKKTSKVPTNGTREVAKAIEEYGCVIDIIALGEGTYDDINQTFKKWHDKLKGEISPYEKKRILRKVPSRRRKINFNIKEIIFIKVDKGFFDKCGIFQKGFRNADGSKRNPKVMIDMKILKDEDVIAKITF